LTSLGLVTTLASCRDRTHQTKPDRNPTKTYGDIAIVTFGNVRLFRKFPNDDLDHFRSSNVIHFWFIDFYDRGFLSDPKLSATSETILR